MSKTILEVKKEDIGLRLDKFLAFSLTQYQRRDLKQLIQTDQVKVNNAIEFHPQYRIQSGDKIEIELPTQTTEINEHHIVKPVKIDLDIIHEDDDILVVNKPTGISTQQGTANYEKTLLGGVKYYLQQKGADLWDEKRSGLLHRLDKDTSGVIVFAKNPRSLSELGNAFARGEVAKEYLAVVKGKFPDQKDVSSNIDGKAAITLFERISDNPKKNLSLLKVNPLSGRKHQIRIHSKNIGFPILGDSQYGGPRADRLMLHAWKISFKLGEKNYTFEAPAPKGFSF